jgi:MFS superfamily sulfate permease-like transporter
VPPGLPPLRLPHFPSTLLPSLLAEAASMTLISFSSMMLTARALLPRIATT